MIFVTVGSQKFQFNRLLETVDTLVTQEKIKEVVFAQTGYSEYKPSSYEYANFLDRERYAKEMEQCKIVITHGGTGAIVGALKNGKKVIAIPRLKKYNEHVDNHQLQIVKQFEEMNFIATCDNLDDLACTIETVKNSNFERYISNTNRIINSIDYFINK